MPRAVRYTEPMTVKWTPEQARLIAAAAKASHYRGSAEFVRESVLWALDRLGYPANPVEHPVLTEEPHVGDEQEPCCCDGQGASGVPGLPPVDMFAPPPSHAQCPSLPHNDMESGLRPSLVDRGATLHDMEQAVEPAAEPAPEPGIDHSAPSLRVAMAWMGVAVLLCIAAAAYRALAK